MGASLRDKLASQGIFCQARQADEGSAAARRVGLTTHGGKLPRSLLDTGDLALISQFTEADTADAVVTQVSVGSSADVAAVVAASRELRFLLLLQNHCFSCHNLYPPNQA